MRYEVPFAAVMALLAIQFAVFGWRVQREIALMEQGRKTWLLLEDYGNLAAMLLVLVFCIVFPLGVEKSNGSLPSISRSVFVAACVLLISYPICLAAHYGLLVRQKGRPIRYLPDGSTDWANYGPLELFLVVASWMIAILAGAAAYGGWL